MGSPSVYLETTTALLKNREAPRADLTPWAWATAKAAKLQAELANTPPAAATTT
jgi:hypothetical protein